MFMTLAAYFVEKEIDVNPQYVGLGIILHGIYDLLVHYQMIPYSNHAPDGYPLACFVADMVMGSAAYFLWKSK